MIVLRNPADIASVKTPEIAQLLAQRFAEIGMGQAFDPEVNGYFVAVEAGDTLEQLEQTTGCQIGSDLFSDAKFGDPEFVPCFEFLEELPFCYEMAFVLNDDGYGVLFAIPKSGMDERLLRYCREFSKPATCLPIQNDSNRTNK